MTVSAPVERPRILARLAEKPGQTAYELAAALGYGKPESRRVAEIVKRLHQAGVLVAGSELRPTMGRPAQVYYIAPAGTVPPRREETPAQREERRRRERISQRRRRARRAGKPVTPEPPSRPGLYLPPPPPAWRMPADPACTGADPGLFFGPDHETREARAERAARATAYCRACPVRRECLDGARDRGERFGIWGGVDLEAELKNRAPQAARSGAATPDRA